MKREPLKPKDSKLVQMMQNGKWNTNFRDYLFRSSVSPRKFPVVEMKNYVPFTFTISGNFSMENNQCFFTYWVAHVGLYWFQINTV